MKKAKLSPIKAAVKFFILAAKDQNRLPAVKWVYSPGTMQLEWSTLKVDQHIYDPYILHNKKKYSIRDHSLGFVGRARPLGAVAEVLTGIYFIACKIHRLTGLPLKNSSSETIRQVYGYMLQELYGAIELLKLITESKNPPNVNVKMAKDFILASDDYKKLEKLLSSKEMDVLKFNRHKLTAHRGVSYLAKEQVGAAKSTDLSVSLLQLESLSSAVFSSERLIEELTNSFGPLLSLSRMLVPLASFFVMKSDYERIALVMGCPVDDWVTPQEFQHKISAVIEKIWQPGSPRIHTDFSLLRTNSEDYKFG